MSKEIPQPQNFGNERHLSLESGSRTRFARAIAVRNINEQQRAEMRIAEITGGQYQPTNPLVREAMILTSTRMNERLLTEPTALPSNVQALMANIFDDLGDGVFDKVVRDVQKDGEEPLSITGSQLRSLSRAIAESAATSLIPAPTIESGFTKTLRQIDEARRIGVERNIDPATVYVDDELYAKLIRRSQTPGEFAKLGIQMTRQITPERMAEMIINMTPAIAQTMGEIEDIPPLMDQEEIQKIKQEMSEDLEFKKEVKTATLQLRRAIRILTGEQIIRFWGQDGLDSLPKSVKANLLRS